MSDKILEQLAYIDSDSYDQWMLVGMALKHEGYGWEVWDDWSRSSPKYQEGVCERKWRSFNEQNAGDPATGGTIDHLARLNGWSDDYGEELILGQTIKDASPTRDYVFVDKTTERENLPEFDKDKYDPRADALAYLNGMFEEDEYIGFNGEFSRKDDRLVPTVNAHSFTAGMVARDVESGPMKKAGVADLNAQAVREAFGVKGDDGCYVRINPLDGHGDGNSNVTRFANALIESDEDDIETQYAIYRKLELPIRFLVHSGHHSLHAIVKVDALNIGEYRERVTFLYAFCSKNGLHVDEANKNPSRYSRMPGVKRGEEWQRIVARDIGKRSWDEWREWVEEENDTLPEEEPLGDLSDIPDLAPELIGGLLREGHKMLLAAPSKAGKSFLLMELAVCIAEGKPWLGHGVTRGKVLYVNLELDGISCKHRFRDIYDAMGGGTHGSDVLVLNLRGRSVPLDKLAPTLIRRYKDRGLKAMIIDPIYKVITGDENAASDMALFCNLFDSIATECGCAMVYSHHFSKGAASKYGNAADRASGSGVFSRDPDAILAMSELKVDEGKVNTYREVRSGTVTPTGWRVSATLREFPTPPDFDVWFDWPLHVPDEARILASTSDVGEQGVAKGQRRKVDHVEELETQFEMETDVSRDNAIATEDLMAVTGFSPSVMKDTVTKSEKLMAATVLTPDAGPVRVVTVNGTECITYGRREYVPKRSKAGSVMKNRDWLLKGGQTSL
jgi:RecA-family ATPase